MCEVLLHENLPDVLGSESHTEIDSHLSESNGQHCPLGTVAPWLKNIPAGDPLVIPAGWVECNGQTLDELDAGHPFYNVVVPDLNGNLGTQRFLRGFTSSGGAGGCTSHLHTASIFQLDACSSIYTSKTYFNGWCASTICHKHYVSLSACSKTDYLPPYHQVVYILRIE